LLEYFNKNTNNYLCNTSYPLDKDNFVSYKVDKELVFNEDKLCLYIHVPFCPRLCAFCEYIKFPKNVNYEEKYLDILEKDVDDFLEQHDFTLYGFDIGGGTPTCLELDNFKRLMDIAKRINNLNHIDDYEPSIEATFNTLSNDKLVLIKEAGFKRISLGIQTVNTEVLNNQNRNVVTVDDMLNTLNMIKSIGIDKVNVDLMYGIKGQSVNDLYNTIECIKRLNPPQVTLYEMRYNMVRTKNTISKDVLFDCYSILYDGLINLGYKGRFSQNTFSKYDDLGLSSYLKYRMIYNISYKGFGIAAQSKTKDGISYNIGKNHESFDDCIKNGSFIEYDTYLLPKEELVAKYVMISLYFGVFSLDIISNVLNEDAYEYYKDELNFLVNHKYIDIVDNKCYLTKEGFKYYGAVGSLFYSKNVKKWIMGE
jgi:oxygen-independent coproporphyrinogen-3 oxidase